MNRREAIQAGLAVLSATGIDGEVTTISTRNPQAFVLRFPNRLTCDAIASIRKQWRQTFAGTPLAEIPCIVLDGGATIEVIDAPDDPSTPRDQMFTPTGRRDYAP